MKRALPTPEEVEVCVRAIEAGAFDDLVAVYRSGQMAVDELWDACAVRAEELTGVSWFKFRREVGLAALGYGRRLAQRDFEAAGGFEKWFTDRITWAEAKR